MMPNDLRAATWSAGSPLPVAGPRGAAGRSGNVTLVRTVDHGAGDVMQLSARNQIPARVTGINAGEAIANVELEANGVRLVASITVEAVRQLGLAEGSEVTAVIKASDVIIAVG
jgi:molybdopterin-binding protein